MTKFLLKTSLFVVPFFVFYLLSVMFYTTGKGDLLRLGYIFDTIHYDEANIFNTEQGNVIQYTKISEVDFNDTTKATVLTIGDSFSELDSVSYQNYLAQNKNITVLHYDRFLHDNPIQTLQSLLNGDLLNKVKVKYIILESIEREFVSRMKDFDTTGIITTDSIVKWTKAHSKPIQSDGQKVDFFSKTILRFPIKTVCYQLNDNAFDSPTYLVKTTDRLFSVEKNELLFYYQDLESVEENNNLAKLYVLNEMLNRLSLRLNQRGIQLIVLPCPDKYDLYYNYLSNKEKYPKPLFFDNFARMEKRYQYVDTKQILAAAIKSQKDIYLFDDTHWSPYAAKIIANKLQELIKING